MSAPLLQPIKAKRGYQSTWLKAPVLASVTAITEHVNGYWKLSVNGKHLGSVECPYCVGDEVQSEGRPATIRKIETAKVGDRWYWALTCEPLPPTFKRIRCDCVDSNGNPWPDCTCNNSWRE